MIFIAVLNCQTTMAVLSFDAKCVSEIETNTLNDRLNEEIYKTGIFILIERNQIESIIVEQGFQQSGCTTSECAVEVGGLLGAQKIITGSVGKIGTLFTINLKIIDINTATIEKNITYDYQGSIEDFVIVGINQAANNLLYGSTFSTNSFISEPNTYTPKQEEPISYPTPKSASVGSGTSTAELIIYGICYGKIIIYLKHHKRVI